MHVNLHDYKEFGKVKTLAVIRMDGGQLQVDRPLPPFIQQELEDQRDRMVGKGDEAFLRSLPRVFSGSYTRAQFVG